MAKQRKATNAGDVHVVKADGSHTPGRILKENEDGTIDVEISHQDQPMKITSSPQDPEGKKHDSWHFPEESNDGAPEVDPPAAQ